MSELTLSLWYLRDLLPSGGQTHDPVPVDVALDLGLLSEGTGDSSGQVGDIIHLQQQLRREGGGGQQPIIVNPFRSCASCLMHGVASLPRNV